MLDLPYIIRNLLNTLICRVRVSPVAGRTIWVQVCPQEKEIVSEGSLDIKVIGCTISVADVYWCAGCSYLELYSRLDIRIDAETFTLLRQDDSVFGSNGNSILSHRQLELVPNGQSAAKRRGKTCHSSIGCSIMLCNLRCRITVAQGDSSLFAHLITSLLRSVPFIFHTATLRTPCRYNTLQPLSAPRLRQDKKSADNIE